MMGYETFKDTLVKRLKQDYPEADVALTSVTKNNGMTYDAVIVRENTNIAPTIYLNEYYAPIAGGRGDFEEAYEAVKALYEANKCIQSIDTDFFTDFDRVRGKIFPKLVCAESNAEMLENVPHVPFLDMAVVFYVKLFDGTDASATIQIDNSHLKVWGVGTDELFRIAMENAFRDQPAKLAKITDVLTEILADEGYDETVMPDVSGDEFPMLVLTNPGKTFGAACMAYEGLLGAYAEKYGSFYILPSSIHEVLLVPSEDGGRMEDFTAMVREVNQTQVEPEEVLSDHAYFYDARRQAVVY